MIVSFIDMKKFDHAVQFIYMDVEIIFLLFSVVIWEFCI